MPASKAMNSPTPPDKEARLNMSPQQGVLPRPQSHSAPFIRGATMAMVMVAMLVGLLSLTTQTADAQSSVSQPQACWATKINNDVRVTWTPAANDNATTYRIRRQREGSSQWFLIGDSPAPARARIDLAPRDGTYRYMVIARNATSGSTARICGPNGGVTFGTPQAVTPTATPTRPLACWAARRANGDIFITWTPAPGDNASDYLVRRSRNGATFWRVGVVNAPNRTFNNTGIRQGTYSYSLEARNASGTSPRTLCGPNGGVTLGDPSRPLIRPTSCTATRIAGSNEVRITWTRAANDNALAYVVRRARNGGAFFRVGVRSTPTSQLTDTSINPGLYTYTVETQAGAVRSGVTRCEPGTGIRI